MKILFAASEVAPLAKTGGLADVSAALARTLRERGHDARLFMPLYRRLRTPGRTFTPVAGLERFTIQLGPHTVHMGVKTTTLPDGLEVYCLDCPGLYDREGIYTGDPDEHLRFAALARGALTACQKQNWGPDIVHAHDWHAALLPLYVKLLRSWDKLFAKTKTVLTLHNLGYQGGFPAEVIPELGLADARHLLHQDELEQGVVRFMTTGLLYADVLTTVSQTYAREIQTEEHGFGLDPILRARRSDLLGIVNGIDVKIWDPAVDEKIPHRYTRETWEEGKARNKQTLLNELGLPYHPKMPLYGVVSRLTPQKGFELLESTLPRFLDRNHVQLIALGSGATSLQDFFAWLQRRFPRQVCYYRGFHDALAHRIEAASDFFLMPSRFEPCGLNQMYSLRYGSIPIVRKTGGLADTVQPIDPRTGQGTGIVFDHFNEDAMRWALDVSLELYHSPGLRRRIVTNAMARDTSWERQSGLYEALYQHLLGRRGGD